MKHFALTGFVVFVVVFAIATGVGVANAAAVFLVKHGAVSAHIRGIEEKGSGFWRISFRVKNRDAIGTFAGEADSIWNQKQLALVDVPGFSYPVLVMDQTGGSRVELHEPLFIAYRPSDRSLVELQQYRYAKVAGASTDTKRFSCSTAHTGSKPVLEYLFDESGEQSGPTMVRFYPIHFSNGWSGIVEVDDPPNIRPTMLDGVSLRAHPVSSGQTPLTTCAR